MSSLFGNVTPPARAEGQYRLLRQHFFDRFFHNDLISAADDPQLTSANLMAVLAFPGMMSLYLIPKYYVRLAEAPPEVRHLAVLGDRWLLLSFSMAVLGLLTVAEWDSLFPDDRDARVFGVLPIRPGTIFAAQAWALARFLGLFFLIINLAAAVFFPIAAVEYEAGLMEGLRFYASHAAGVFAGSLFIVSLMIALQGALIAVLDHSRFRRVSPWVQLFLMFLLFAALILIPVLSRWALGQTNMLAADGGEFSYALLLPPLWFVGLSESLNGNPNPAFHSLAKVAAAAAGLTLALAIFCYSMSYQRFLRRSLESPAGSRRSSRPERSGPATLVERFLARSTGERVSFYFLLKTLARSRSHRLHVTAFLAVGLAVALSQWMSGGLAGAHWNAPNIKILSLAYIPAFMLLAGMRSSFSRPAELPANWVFQLTAGESIEEYSAGTQKAMTLLAGLPIALATALQAWLLWGWAAAMAHLIFFLAAIWVSAQLALWGFPKIPFTCTFVPARAQVIFLWTACALALFTYSATLGKLEAWALAEGPRFFLALCGGAALSYGLTAYQGLTFHPSRRPVFHETADPVVHRLHLEA